MQTKDILLCHVPWISCMGLTHILCRVVLDMTHIWRFTSICQCLVASKLEVMKVVVKRMRRHIVVEFDVASLLPGLEFQGENSWLTFVGNTWQ